MLQCLVRATGPFGIASWPCLKLYYKPLPWQRRKRATTFQNHNCRSVLSLRETEGVHNSVAMTLRAIKRKYTLGNKGLAHHNPKRKRKYNATFRKRQKRQRKVFATKQTWSWRVEGWPQIIGSGHETYCALVETEYTTNEAHVRNRGSPPSSKHVEWGEIVGLYFGFGYFQLPRFNVLNPLLFFSVFVHGILCIRSDCLESLDARQSTC